MRICHVILWLMALPTLVLGQVEVRFFPTDGHFSPDHIGMVKLYNPSGETFQAQLVGELRDSVGVLVGSYKSRVFELGAGVMDISQNPSIIRSFSAFGNISPLGIGQYNLCVLVHNNVTQQEIGKKCKEITLYLPSDSLEKKAISASPFSFHGQANLLTQTSNRLSIFQQTPNDFVRWQMTPQLTLFNIPLAANLFLTTEHQTGKYELNNFTLQLDRSALQTRLQKKLQDKLKAEQQKIQKGLPYDEDFLQKLEGIKEAKYQDAIRQAFEATGDKINPEDLEKHIGELAQLERIEQALTHPIFAEAEGEWNKWRKKFDIDEASVHQRVKDSLAQFDVAKYEELLQLESRYQEYLKLTEKRDYLQQLKQQLPEVEQLKAKLATLERLQHQDLQSLLADPKVSEKMANLKGPQKWLHATRNIGIGNSYPIYSPLSLEGMQVNGLHLEVQPGNGYAMITAGKLQQPLFLSDSIAQPFPAQLFALKAGYGTPESNHLYATYMRIEEQLTAPSDSTMAWYGPQQNVLMGLAGQLSLFEDKLQLQGEIMQSQIWRSDVSNYFPAQAVKWESQDSLSALDTAKALSWRVEARYTLPQGQVRSYYEWIPPNYVSLGMPFLVADRRRYGAELTQSFWEGRAQTTIYHKRDISQFRRFQRVPSIATSSGVRASLRPGPKWPFVQVNYAPMYQETGLSDSLNSSRNQALLNVNSGIHFRIGGLEGQSMISYVQQLGGKGGGQGGFATRMYTFSQLLTFQTPISFTMSFSQIESQAGVAISETKVADFAGNMTLFKKWQSSLGGLYMEEKGGNPQVRKGLYAQNSYPLTNSLLAGLRAECYWLEHISENTPNPFEYLINLSLTYNW